MTCRRKNFENEIFINYSVSVFISACESQTVESLDKSILWLKLVFHDRNISDKSFREKEIKNTRVTQLFILCQTNRTFIHVIFLSLSLSLSIEQFVNCIVIPFGKMLFRSLDFSLGKNHDDVFFSLSLSLLSIAFNSQSIVVTKLFPPIDSILLF